MFHTMVIEMERGFDAMAPLDRQTGRQIIMFAYVWRVRVCPSLPDLARMRTSKTRR